MGDTRSLDYGSYELKTKVRLGGCIGGLAGLWLARNEGMDPYSSP